MDKEKLIKLLNSHTAYIMDIQRAHMCRNSKTNQRLFIKALIEYGFSKEDAIEIENAPE